MEGGPPARRGAPHLLFCFCHGLCLGVLGRALPLDFPPLPPWTPQPCHWALLPLSPPFWLFCSLFSVWCLPQSGGLLHS